MTVHVYPEEDWIDHRLEQHDWNCNCPCEPYIEYFNPITGEKYDEPLIIHNRVGPEPEEDTLPGFVCTIKAWWFWLLVIIVSYLIWG